MKIIALTPAELETGIRFAFLVQRLGPKDMAAMLSQSAVSQLWEGS